MDRDDLERSQDTESKNPKCYEPQFRLDFSGLEKADINTKRDAMLLLEDGTTFTGYSFGASVSQEGEVVFNTGMVGYPEALTDPSYCGQILVLTFPLIGNYGVPPDVPGSFGLSKHFESSKIFVRGLIVSDYTHQPSHYAMSRTLSTWLKSQNVPAIYDVDTRALTKKIREKGSMLGKILISLPKHEKQESEKAVLWKKCNPNSQNLVAEVSRKTIDEYSNCNFGSNLKNTITSCSTSSCSVSVCQSTSCCSSSASNTNSFIGGQTKIDGQRETGKWTKRNVSLGRPVKIMLVDCGVKLNIIRFLLGFDNVTVKVVPWNHDFNRDDDWDGLFLSNGPGDPTKVVETISNLRVLLQDTKKKPKPIFGVCLGNQLLALAAGAKTYKMKFGNRGMNQSVIDLRTTSCYITPQNHGYAVDVLTLPPDWQPLFVNANDFTNEGIIHAYKPFFSVQFHPEAMGGPHDTAFLFDMFFRYIREERSRLTTIEYIVEKRVKKILLIGSGGLSIGQAGEFDYSGSQAIKALKEEQIFVILVNPNIATVQTSHGMADQIYFLPILPEFIEKVIQKERGR